MTENHPQKFFEAHRKSRYNLQTMRTDDEKRKRHDLIRKIIQSKPVGTQDELVAEILGRDLKVTQTTVSRDLVEMQVGKWNGKYHIPLDPGDSPPWFETVRQQVLQFTGTGDHLVVLKTKPGASAIVEKALNDYVIEEITGVVASGNTVMVAFEKPANQQKILELFAKALA